MVIDLAVTASGDWIVIECNNAMESGYACVSPLGLWQPILDAVKECRPQPTNLQDHSD